MAERKKTEKVKLYTNLDVKQDENDPDVYHLMFTRPAGGGAAGKALSIAVCAGLANSLGVVDFLNSPNDTATEDEQPEAERSSEEDCEASADQEMEKGIVDAYRGFRSPEDGSFADGPVKDSDAIEG